jgi:hypothetical protein
MALVRWHLVTGVSALGLVATGTGCGSSRQLTGTMSAYEIGNYHQAAERCENVDEAALDGRKQVRYYVYCGLAHYRLGDQDNARNLLTVGKQKYEAGSSTWLKPIIVDEMNKALGTMTGSTFAPSGMPPYAQPPGYGLQGATSSASIRGRSTE